MKELYSDNFDLVSGAIEDIFKDDLVFKSHWAKQAQKCVQFANGDLVSDERSGVGVNHQPPPRERKDIVAYVGSEIEPIVRTIVSYMTRSRGTVDISSLAKDNQSRNVAKIAEKIMDAKYDLDNESDQSRNAAYWSVVTGHNFSKDYWDTTLGEYIAEINPATGEVVKDEMGATIYSKRAGSNSIAMLSGLSMIVDHSVLDFKKMPYVGDSYLADVEWAKEAFNIQEKGYTGRVSMIKEDNNLSDAMQILESMKFSVPYLSKGKGEKSKGKCIIRELCLQPTREFQKGRMIVMAGSEVVYMTDREQGSPYYMELESTEWHPYESFRYQSYIGRFLGKGLVAQLIALQTRLYAINMAILKNANTIARPRIMCTNEQIPTGTIAGDKDIIRYKNMPSVREPYILQGAPLPAQFFNERQAIIDEMVRIAGTNFVMQGQPPTGVTAGSAIAQLLENANTQHSGMMNAWEKFHERRYTKKLRLLHKFHQYPDKQLDRYVKTLSTDSLDTEVQDFVGQRDLSDGVVLKIQYGSMIPKSEAAKKDLYEKWADKGILGPIAEDSPRGAELRNKLLEKFGEDGLDTMESVHVKKAKWENDRIMQGKPVEVSKFDVGPIHLECHKSEFLDPLFLERADENQVAMFTQHIEEHEAIEQEKSMQAQQAQMQAQLAANPNAPKVPSGMPQAA